MMSDAKVSAIFRLLKKAYPGAAIALSYRNPLELLVATILSAQCTDARVNIVTVPLFKKYKTVRDYASARQGLLERGIHSTGFYRNKAKHIIASARMIRDEFGGLVPDSMEKLLLLPGVARKTANIVLSHAFGKREGIAVDTHVLRLSRRLGLTKEEDPGKVERDLMRIVPRKEWKAVNDLLIAHGRAVCVARTPKCPACVLGRLCPSKKVYFSHTLKRSRRTREGRF